MVQTVDENCPFSRKPVPTLQCQIHSFKSVMHGSLGALQTWHDVGDRKPQSSIDLKTCCSKFGFSGDLCCCILRGCSSLIAFNKATDPCWEGIWAREQFRKIGNPSHYPLPLIYYVCNSGLEGGQINIVWKSDKLLCLHQSNKKGESQRESWKNPPRNRSCSVSHSMCSPCFVPCRNRHYNPTNSGYCCEVMTVPEPPACELLARLPSGVFSLWPGHLGLAAWLPLWHASQFIGLGKDSWINGLA